MSKNYQKAARGWLYALAAVIAGTCFSASPAQSATCFLPSGECSTGKIGAGPGPTPTPEYCIGYNITEKEYNAKYNNACWDCSDSCVKTSGGTFYKCKTVNNTTWYDKYSVCCTDGTKYDADDGKCCAGGKCDHPCEAGKSWSPTLKQCVCPSNVETDKDGNCCASGQVLDNGVCTTPCEMNPCGDYPYTSDPGNSEYCDLGCGKGMRYKCQDGYTYSGGKCVEKCAASGYTLTSAKDSNCYSCSTCPYDSSKYKCTKSEQTGYQLSGDTCVDKCSDYTLTSKKDEYCYFCTPCPYNPSKFSCTENVQSGYQLVNGVCSKKPVEKVTITIALDATSTTVKFTTSASDGKNYTVKLSLDGSGDAGISYPVVVAEGKTETYSAYDREDGDCDVNGDNCDNQLGQGREWSSDAYTLGVIVNNNTVLSGLKSSSGGVIDMTTFIGKSYTTNDYIIKFVENKSEEPTSYTITVTDTTTRTKNDKVTIARTVTCTDSTVTVDVISNADVTEERSDWDCNTGYGSSSLTIKNGVKDSYDDVNIESGGSCDYTRTYLNWKDTTVKIGSTTKTYKNTSCKEDTITVGKKTYNVVCKSTSEAAKCTIASSCSGLGSPTNSVRYSSTLTCTKPTMTNVSDSMTLSGLFIQCYVGAQCSNSSNLAGKTHEAQFTTSGLTMKINDKATDIISCPGGTPRIENIYCSVINNTGCTVNITGLP